MDEDFFYCPFMVGGCSWLPCMDDPELECSKCRIFQQTN